jgi:hypothetical protein
MKHLLKSSIEAFCMLASFLIIAWWLINGLMQIHWKSSLHQIFDCLIVPVGFFACLFGLTWLLAKWTGD